MADIEHSDIGTAEIHIIYNWTYADAAARAAAVGLLSGDVGKVARQLDDNSLWMLIDESPVTWKDIGTSSSSRAANPLDDVGQMIVGGASGAETKLEPGGEGEFLQIISGEPAWGSAGLTLSNNSISNALLRDSAALSVIGRSANSTGDPADIAASNDGEVLRRSGTSLGFGTVATAGLADDAVTNAKLANMAQDTIKGRASGAGTGDPTDLSAAQVRAILLEMQRWVFNFTADGDAYLAADVAMTIDIGTAAIGTGTLAYEKSTAAAPSTFSSTTLPAALQAGAWLKVSVSSLSGFKAVELKRTA